MGNTKLINFFLKKKVRAAAIYALGCLIGDTDRVEEVLQIENTIAISLVLVTADSSPLVRKEVTFFFFFFFFF